MSRAATGQIPMGLLASIPWCCILPAILSLTGLGGAVAARWIAWRLNPLLFGLAILMVGRALFLIHRKGQGNRISRYFTWASAIIIAALWLPRAWAVLR